MVKFTAKADIEKLEKALRAYMYAKVPNDMNTKRAVERSFADFDTDGSKCVSIDEFISFAVRMPERSPEGVVHICFGVVGRVSPPFALLVFFLIVVNTIA